jgi:hypothetical protein
MIGSHADARHTSMDPSQPPRRRITFPPKARSCSDPARQAERRRIALVDGRNRAAGRVVHNLTLLVKNKRTVCARFAILQRIFRPGGW